MVGKNMGTCTSDEDRAFQFQLDFLRREFESINGVIGRIDGTTQGTKNWAVAVWAGAVALLVTVRFAHLEP